MEEVDRSDAAHEDNVASQTTVENLNLFTEKLQTIFRGVLGLVRDVVEQSVGARLQVKGLKALMETMSEKIDKLTEVNRALRSQTQCQLHSRRRLPHQHHLRYLRDRNGNGRATNRRSCGEIPPPQQLLCTLYMQAWRPIPRNLRHQHQSSHGARASPW